MRYKLFAELNGFVVYNPSLLEDYLDKNSLDKKDVLKHFTETEHGDIITREGIAIPIIGLPDDYYNFQIGNKTTVQNKMIDSAGWIFNGQNGIVRIMGIGYFKDMSAINEINSLNLRMEEGWKELSIISYYDDEPGFILEFEAADHKPDFSGDLETNYGFEW